MADANLTPVDSFANINSILNLVKSPGNVTSTTSNNISQQGLQQFINQILSGNQGLAAVASGQHTAGLYNGTTSQLLINNLLTQTAGEASKLSASQSTVRHTAPTFDPMQLITGLVAGKGLNYVSGKLGIGKNIDAGFDKLTKSISDLFGGASSEGAITSEAAPVADLSATLGSDVSATLPGAIDAAGFAGGAAGDVAASTALTGTGAGVAGADIAAGSAATDVAGFTALDSAAAAEGGGLAIGTAAGAGEIAGAAGATDVAGLAALDSAAAAGEGSFFADAIPVIAETAAAWVICTELNSGGELHDELYQASAQRALSLSYEILEGYRYWAIPATRVLRSGRFRRIASFIATKRCEYLLGKTSFIGWATVSIGEPICGFIGKRLIERGEYAEDYRSLYVRN